MFSFDIMYQQRQQWAIFENTVSVRSQFSQSSHSEKTTIL